MSPDLGRREFLTRGLLGRVTALLAGGVAGGSVEAAADAPPMAAGVLSARDLRKMSRGEVRAALSRIRARWRAR
jgi:hypothetical protein